MLLLLAAFVYGCETKNCHCPIDDAIVVENDNILQKTMSNADFKRLWQKLDEPILFRQNKETYRFFYRAPANDFLRLYRIEKNINDYALYIKEFVVVDGDQMTLKKNYSRKLSEPDWLETIQIIDNKCFWTMPLKREKSRSFDSTACIIEGFKPEGNNCTSTKYHYVEREKLENVPSFVDIIHAFEGLESKSSY